VGVCILIGVNTVHKNATVRKNAIGVVLHITRFANCPMKAWNRQSNTQVSGAGNNPVSQGGRPPTRQLQEATEVEKGRKEVTE